MEEVIKDATVSEGLSAKYENNDVMITDDQKSQVTTQTQ